MAFFAGMNDRSAPRAYPWIWFIRLIQLVLTIIVLGVSAVHAYDFRDCNVPSKIAYNIACAVLSFIVLIYFILSTGPSRALKVLPWLIWGQLALDGLLFVLWIAAAGASVLNCDDLCKACSPASSVSWSNLDCTCYGTIFYKRDMSPVPRSPILSRRARSSRGRLPSDAARTAIDALLVPLFAFTIAATIAWFFLQNRSSGRGSSAPATQPPAGTGEQGVPMQTNPQPPATTYNPQQPLSEPQMQQGQQFYPQSHRVPQQPMGAQPQAPGFSYTNPETHMHPSVGPTGVQ